jgi:transforming growth factor-beta-induced protein
MLVKVLLGLCALSSISAISLITLPSVEVDFIHDKLAAEKPYVLLSPNDASLTSMSLNDLEKQHHGQPKLQDAKNLVDLAESLNLTTLVKALEETGLDQTIDHEGKFTLFAPTNEAFENVPKWASKLPLRELLKYHVARGLIYADDITNEYLARSLLAKRDIRLNIYKNGGLVTANGSPITAVNFTAHNGVLHIIDKVMVNIYEREGSIGRELKRCPTFQTLSKLLAIAGLEDALHAKGPYTLFAPTDEVFAKVPADCMKHLVDNPAVLRQVLLYHVVGGTYFSAGLEDGLTLDSLQTGKLVISIADGNVMVGKSAKVTVPDATASNGVIHAIDSVLMPPAVKRKMAKLTKRASRKHLKGANHD